MANWWRQFVRTYRELELASFDVGESPGVAYAFQAVYAAISEMTEQGLSAAKLMRRTCDILGRLSELPQDPLLVADAIAHGELGALVQESAHLAQVVSEWFRPGDDSMRYVPLFQEILYAVYERPVSGWSESTERAREVAGELRLELETSELVAALIIAAAVVLSVYFIFFYKKRPEEKASSDFAEISEEFASEDWARALLKNGSARDWSLPNTWQKTSLDAGQMERAINAIATLKNGQLIQPERGSSYVDASMLSEQSIGEYVWDCERPGLRWKTRPIARPRVVRTNAEYLALDRSNGDGRKLYFEAFEQRHGRPPGPDDFLEGGLVEDVYHSLSADVERYDEWLRTLIDSCPENLLLQPACADSDEEYVEQLMVSVNKLLVKADAHVEKILHRGLVRWTKANDGSNRRRREVLYRALVEAADREVDDAYDLM